MKRPVLTALLCGTVASAALVNGAPVETVHNGGGGDHLTINAAIASVDPGGLIQITEAADYTLSVTLDGGKSYTIEATVPGVISSGPWTADASLGNVDVTVRDFSIIRSAGTGPAIDLDQHLTNTVTLVLEDMIVRQTEGVGSGQALKLDDGVAGGAAMSVTATNTEFSITSADPNGEAVQIQSDVAQIENVTINMTNCDLSTGGGAAVRSDGGANQNWTFVGGSLTSPADQAFELDDPHPNSSFSFTDVTITAALEAVDAEELLDTNVTWVFDRCTLDCGGAAAATRVTDLRYANDPSNTITAYNNLIIVPNTGRGLHFEGSTTVAHHNTIVCTGALGDRALSSSAAGAYDFSNNIFQNFNDPVGGSTGTKTGNIIAGGSDDTSAGGDRIFTTIGALNLDGSFVPQPPSVAFAAGDPAIDDVVGNVDRNGSARPDPVATPPDVGCYETSSVPVTLDMFGVE